MATNFPFCSVFLCIMLCDGINNISLLHNDIRFDFSLDIVSGDSDVVSLFTKCPIYYTKLQFNVKRV